VGVFIRHLDFADAVLATEVNLGIIAVSLLINKSGAFILFPNKNGPLLFGITLALRRNHCVEVIHSRSNVNWNDYTTALRA
jgi:hypothetical protein